MPAGPTLASSIARPAALLGGLLLAMAGACGEDPPPETSGTHGTHGTDGSSGASASGTGDATAQASAGDASADGPGDGTPGPIDDLPTDGFLGGFFPIGVFGQPSWTMQGWADIGCNTMLEAPQGESLADWDAQAQRLGLRVIRRPLGAPSSDRGRTDLLAWSLPDEPDVEANNAPCGGNCVSLIESMSAQWRAADPTRPIFVNIAGPNVMQPRACDYCNGPGDEAPSADCYPDNDQCYPRILATADWVSQDIYPVTGWLPDEAMRDDITVVGRTLDRIGDWTDQPKFAIVELSDQRLNFNGAGTRGPTADEVRAEVWHAIIHGARGIFYFPQAFNPFEWVAVPSEVVAEMVVQHELLDALGPLVQADIDPDVVSVVVDAPLEVTWRVTDGSVWLFVLNTANAPGTATIRVAGDLAGDEAVTYAEDRVVAHTDGTLTDAFDPLQVHIYVLQRA
jgi:hypothetical protein